MVHVVTHVFKHLYPEFGSKMVQHIFCIQTFVSLLRPWCMTCNSMTSEMSWKCIMCTEIKLDIIGHFCTQYLGVHFVLFDEHLHFSIGQPLLYSNFSGICHIINYKIVLGAENSVPEFFFHV